MINTELIDYFQRLPEKIIATVHRDPDYDAIGSLLAMGVLVNALGKDITLYSPDINLKQFKQLPGVKKIQKTPKSEYDLGIFLDCSDKNRIANPTDFPDVKKIMNIDHHQDNTQFGDINLVLNTSSVGEILFNLYKALNVEITQDVGINLYAAICFDTGNFRFSNTTPDTFLVAADLLKRDINISKISEWIFEEKPVTYFEDVKQGLNNMYIDPNYPLLIVYIPYHANISRESTVNFFRQLENVELVIVCKEVQKNDYRINFRSKQYINVAEIAKEFNGGGHVRASGATCQTTFSTLKKKMVFVARKAFQ